MAELRLTESARADLADMDAFGAEHFGQEAADGYQRGLQRVFSRIENFPLSGEERPDFGAGIRCIPYRSHRVIYLANGDEALIIRILHHSRDVPRHLPR